MLDFIETEALLKLHGIDSVEDKSTGSSLEDDLGLKSMYKVSELMEWLGY
jgi:hypothetical protein